MSSAWKNVGMTMMYNMSQVRLTVEGIDVLLQGFLGDAAVALGQDVDTQRQQHPGPLWGQAGTHTWNRIASVYNGRGRKHI